MCIRDRIRSLRFLQDSRRLNLLTFIVFFIPGTPKDLLSYFIGLTDMKLGTWLCITAVARIPSIVTSTVTGDALGLSLIHIFARTGRAGPEDRFPAHRKRPHVLFGHRPAGGHLSLIHI